MDNKVYFVPYHIRKTPTSLLERLKSACIEAGIEQYISEGDLCALKMHFGEAGLTSYLRPAYPRTLVELLTRMGAKPFLTDTNTLYRAARHNAYDHLLTAHRNGFSFGATGAPIIIADGIHGHAYQDFEFTGGKHFSSVQIPDAVHDADSLLMLNHFTAHLAASFGAAIKNMSMGCSNPQGKRRMHCHSKPSVDKESCIACGECAIWCPTGAIKVADSAVIDEELCMACGECTVVCPVEAVKIPWDVNSSRLQEKMAEYALAVHKQKEGKVFLINCLVDMTPSCDCMGFSEPAFKPDEGILLGSDPVAIDQAAIDFVMGKLHWNGKELVAGTPGDPLREIYPKLDWNIQLEYGQTIGLGSRQYEMHICT